MGRLRDIENFARLTGRARADGGRGLQLQHAADHHKDGSGETEGLPGVDRDEAIPAFRVTGAPATVAGTEISVVRTAPGGGLGDAAVSDDAVLAQGAEGEGSADRIFRRDRGACPLSDAF